MWLASRVHACYIDVFALAMCLQIREDGASAMYPGVRFTLGSRLSGPAKAETNSSEAYFDLRVKF